MTRTPAVLRSHGGLNGLVGEEPVVVLLAGPALGEVDDVGVGRGTGDEVDDAVFARAGAALVQAGQQQIDQPVAHSGLGGQCGVEAVLGNHESLLLC
jgi:hypothetical protein